MKYNNRQYPHPVLGVDNFVDGEFSCRLTVESDRENITLRPVIFIESEQIKSHVENGSAEISMQVYCRGTMFRESFRIVDLLSNDVKIPSNKLHGETEVDFFVCAKTDINNYSIITNENLVNNLTFNVEKGDIIAYGGKGKFFANKSPEQLKAVSSIMKIKEGKHKEGAFKLEFDDPKFISIILSAADYDYYSELKGESANVNIIHASMVLPALVETAHRMESDNSDLHEFQNNEWYKIFSENYKEAKGNSPLEKVQNLLDLPLNREFLSMKEQEDY